MLHVSNQCILPVNHIQRTIGSKLEIRGTEIQVTGDKQVMAIFGSETGILINDFVLFCTEKTDIVIDQNITLYFIREMSTRYKFNAGGGTHLVGCD